MRGFVWHVQSDGSLLEWVDSLEANLACIHIGKAKKWHSEEHARLMRPVVGALPKAVVQAGLLMGPAWDDLVAAKRAYEQAWAAYGAAGRAVKAGRLDTASWAQMGEEYDTAAKAFAKAKRAYSEQWYRVQTAVTRNKQAIEELHRKECPNCPWDGKTIFPKGE